MRPLRCGLALLLLTASLAAGTPARATQGSRVIVSNTLNDTLQIFDASTLQELQLPVVSKGAGPVRLAVAKTGARSYLFSANHGIAGSLGVFDLSGDTVTELPASPFPTGALGSVGISVGLTAQPVGPPFPYVAVTNTYQALAGCGVPKGSVTLFDGRFLDLAGIMLTQGTTELSGAQPFAVQTNGGETMFATSNCANTLDVLDARWGTTRPELAAVRRTTVATGAGPDGIAYDAERDDVYVANIGSSTLSVFRNLVAGGTPAQTSVAVGKGPIEVTLAKSLSGRTWLITGNGGAGSISIVDRDVVAACLAAGQSNCSAEVARIPTGVPAGAPESVAYDAASNRVFVVNKTFPPSLSVIQLTEGADGSVTGQEVGPIPLGAIGSTVSIPAVIAFDVVVQPR